MRHPTLVIVMLYLMVAPFYVFSSAMPQPADLLILALGAVVGLTTGFVPALRHFFSSYALLFFVAYVIAVSTYWAVVEQRLQLGKGSILINPLFYVFNMVVFLTILTLFIRHRAALLQAVMLGAGATLIVQAVIGTFHTAAGSVRQELFFNNPNQLGFFALLLVTIFAVGAKWLAVPFWYQAAVFGAAIYLTLLSLSKAAIIATGLLVLITLVRRPGTALSAGLVIGSAFYFTDFGATIVRNTEQRLSTVGSTGDDNLEARGYGRIVEYPEHLGFGAAEGAYDRFSPAHPIEIHSSAGTVLFAYGVVGSSLLIVFVCHVLRRSSLELVAYLAPVGFYTLTHQGLRDTLFWILLAFLQGLSVELAAARRSLPSEVPAPPRGRAAVPAAR